MSVVEPPAKHDHQTLKFPPNFLWGAASSAFQVEGNNQNSDWWHWEQEAQKPSFRSGLACDHYHLYNLDFGMAQGLGHNSHRLSIEWSRIEPREGEFDQHEIEHYQQVLKSLKDKGITVMLTLHHFSNPQWVAEMGGWENGQTVQCFGRFVQRIVPELKEYVDMWVTINEPGVYVYMAYLAGLWPPQKKNRWSALKAYWNLAQAHKKAYKIIHKLVPKARVGMAQNVQSYTTTHSHSLVENLAVIFSDLSANHAFYYLTRHYHDFLGVNYYFHYRYNELKITDVTEQSREVSDLGWEVYPEGIFNVLEDMSDHIPIYITECGIASTNDDRRTRFLIHYLQEVYRAIQSGVDVRGFFYWSLTDNMELHNGFNPRFGLIDIDYSTQKRTIRKSAFVYREIIEHNGIPHHLLKLLAHGLSSTEINKVIESD